MESEEAYAINGIPTTRIIQMAEKIVAQTPNLKGNKTPWKKGVYLVMLDKLTSTVILHERIGKIPIQDVQQYLNLANEKAFRVLPRHTLFMDVSSYQSRDTELGKWGGAIIARDVVISVSGLKELIDEATALVLAKKMNCLSYIEAEMIGKISGSNEFIIDLYNLVGDVI